MTNEYDDIYKLDMGDEWMNGAYTEDGSEAVCDVCGKGLYYDPVRDVYYCRGCGNEMSRMIFFNHIGANPPGSHCVTWCRENYPLCKRHCAIYEIHPDDPMLT